MNTNVLSTDILIQAPARRVWDVLTRLDRYANWNPFIVSADGRVQPTQRLAISIRNGGKLYAFKPTVIHAEPLRQFAWLGHLLVPGLFDGYHEFLLDEVEPGVTRLTQRETFRGLLSGWLLRSMRQNTLTGFQAMNEALKTQAEAATSRA